MVGKVPVCRTGIYDGSGADGHGNECPYGADGFYAEMLGVIGVDWTDVQSNAAYYATNASDFNIPGDNQFDQRKISQINLFGTGKVQLGFGRIDLSIGIATEVEAERTYFNKLHRYKTADPSFLPGRIVCDRMYINTYANPTESCIGSMAGVVGMNNIDFVQSGALPTVPSGQDADQLYSTQNGPFLFFFKGYGQPMSGINGKGVFWTSFNSHWGYWYQLSNVSSGANAMQERLAENSFTLDYVWSIWGLRYLYHRMGMGLDAGDMMKQSINNQGWSTGPYTYKFNNLNNGDFHGSLYMDQMGDPALRLFMFAPPSGLGIGKNSGHPVLTWTASTEPTVTGYHVYRAANASGTYTRLTTTPVSGTTFTDTSVTSGTYVYMVRATRLESTGGGSYYNASLGITQSINLNAASTPVSIVTTSLPSVSWNTAVSLTLSGSGGYPQYSWAITSGSLPSGLTLSTAGVISGTTQATGSFPISVRATDQIGQQSSPQALTLTVSQNSQSFIYPTWTTYTDKQNPTTSNGFSESDLISGLSAYMYETFHLYDLSGVNPNNGVAKATLYLYVTPTTAAGIYAPVQANLIADAVDGWTSTSLNYNNRPTTYDTNVPTLTGSGTDTPGTLLQFDVTSYVNEVMTNFPGRQMGIRFFTGTPQTLAVGSLNSFGGSIPYLIIQTTNAPNITVNSPTMNPAYITAGSGILLNTTVTPLASRAGSLTLQWSQVSGPGTTTFTNPSAAVTGANFSAPGIYVLQLTANDGVETSTQILTISTQNNPVLGPGDNLVLRLPFDETSGATAYDYSGVSPANNGTLTSTGSTLPAWTSSGRIGGALSFSGSGSRVDVPDSNTNPLDGTSQMSFSLWIKPGVLPTGGNEAFFFSKDSSYYIELGSASGGISPGFFTVNNHGTYTTARFAANVWYHLVMVFDGTQPTNNLQFYVNGSPDILTTISYNSVPRNATSLHIGAKSATDANGFNGLIDEVRIYKRVLSLSEIQALAQAVPSDIGPVITTSPSLSGSVGQALPLTASVSSTSNTLSYNWSELSGPFTLTIASPASLSTTTTPPVSGLYNLLFAANDGFITTFAKVAATITGTTYASWAAQNGLSGSNALMTAVVANDGFSNLLKYALGLNPATRYNSGSAGMPSVAVHSNYLSLTFNGVATDVTYKVQASSDLAGAWATIQTFPSGGAAPGTQTVQDSQPMSAYSKRFMRLMMSAP